VALSLDAGFSASLAAEPPDTPAVSDSLEPVVASLLSLELGSLVEGELSLDLPVVLVDVVDVFCAAAASALVFVGGVISGVLFGTVSDTVLPPHAPSASVHSNAAHAASATYPTGHRRALTTVPYACRTWGSR
jgi:hypothetical protein